MKHIYRFILAVVLLSNAASAQNNLITAGNQSPIVKGAKNKINYLTQQKTKLNIPDELIPYLSGLLMMNKIDANSGINQAVTLWISKYNQLKTAINALPSGTNKALAGQQLQKGNFTAVENLLNIHTSYTALSGVFSNSIQTSGDLSPIIIGDYNNVTLTVSKVIEYDLPEGITVNLLSELKSKDVQIKTKTNTIQVLQGNLEDKELTITSWVKRYKEIEIQLKNSPGEIGKKAYVLFQNGDLNGALLELDKSSGGDVIMAQNRILKAKIMLLKFDYSSVDEQLNKIKIYYQTSVPFVPTYTNYMEFARFLVDYRREYADAIPNLQMALNKSTTFNQKVEILNYLSICYTSDRLKSLEYLQNALAILNDNEPLKTDSLIAQKAIIQYNIGFSYSSGGYDKESVLKTIEYDKQALVTNNRILGSSFEKGKRSAVIHTNLGKMYYQSANNDLSMVNLKQSQAFYESKISQKPELFSPLAEVYSCQSEVFFNQGLKEDGLRCLETARNLVEPNVSVRNKASFTQLSGIYGSLVAYFSNVNMDSTKTYLLRLDRILDPLIKADRDNFSISRAAIYADLGTAYVTQANYPTAIKYLEQSYDIFSSNLSKTEINTPKFYGCITQLNAAYIGMKQFDKALAYDNALLVKVQNIAKFNPVQFQTIIPQIYSQISSVYLNMNELEKAVSFCKMAIAPIEVITKQYPLLYVNHYVTYHNQLIYTYLVKNDIAAADSVITRFDATWNSIYAISDMADKLLRCTVADATANFGFSFYQIESNKGMDKVLLRKYTRKFLGFAESEFKNWVIVDDNKMDIAKMATFYSRRAYLENDLCMPVPGDEVSYDQHMANKCDYLGKTKNLLGKLPINSPVSQNIRAFVAQIPASNCGN